MRKQHDEIRAGEARVGATPQQPQAGPPLPDPGRLSDEQIAALRRVGTVRRVSAGEVLFREGDRGYDFFVILTAGVKIVDHRGSVERDLVTGGPREFVAELNLLTGERLFTSAVITEPGEILEVPLAKLQAMISRDDTLGRLILETVLARRQWLAGVGTGFTIIGSRSSADTSRLLEFAGRNRLPHVWLDLDVDAHAKAVVAYQGVDREMTPVVIMRGGDVLVQPSNTELARAAGLGTRPAPGVTYDVVIVGAGPAGLAAAVYGASEGLSTALVDALAVGGQIGTTSKVENYLGFPLGISGEQFAQRAFLQVLRFGASLVLPATALAMSATGATHALQLDTGEEISARSVIIACGVSYRRLDLPGLDGFSSDVFYTPLVTHGEIPPGEPVVIVGGGNSAGQAAIALSDSGHPVTILVRGDDLSASMSQYLIDRIASEPDIHIRNHSEVRDLDGHQRLEWVGIENTQTAAPDRLRASALFVMIGAEPRTGWLGQPVQLDPAGYVLTGPDLGRGTRHRAPWTSLDRDPYLLETSVPGVFAAGDVRSGSVKRAASGVGEGSIAIRFVSEHLGRRGGLARPR